MEHIERLLTQSDSLRFKLLALVGENIYQKKRIIDYLKGQNWLIVDVESELIDIVKYNSSDEGFIASEVKKWFNAKPNKLILTNADILYDEMFVKMSPVGAFKYNTRNKNCVLFLEKEKMLSSRLYYSEIGKNDYYDQEINDIIMVDIDEVDITPVSVSSLQETKRQIYTSTDQLNPDAIGHYFDFHLIKDVVDIDSDLQEENKRRELVTSYIISESLENQIVEFFEDLKQPKHKARTIIGNYGSGKSHLVGFLVGLIEEPALGAHLKSEKIASAIETLDRKFYHIQFELQAGQVDLKQWFYGKIRQQAKDKYGIEIPVFDETKDFDDKENIKKIIEIIKSEDSTTGLLVIIDEISDFLASRQKEAMKADLQFLRLVGQVCQDSDIMFVGSMQEDVFSSPKFKDVAQELGRVGERFQNIIIHKEDVKKVISQRIVPKSEEQKHKLETELVTYAEKITAVSTNMDEYVEMFPLTPFLLELFSSLPYFEKRGVIQFAMNEVKYLLNEPFPYFVTFDKIFDLLANNPNKKNLEEIHSLIKVMEILKEKIKLLDIKYQNDAVKLVKGLAIYSLWNQKEKGATAEELSDNLMILPPNKMLSAKDNISLVIKKLREVTDSMYIKTKKDKSTGIEYFSFETTGGPDIGEKISQKASAVSDGEIEQELFDQLIELLELERIPVYSNLFEDECEWSTVKSFRKGYFHFIKYKSKKISVDDYRDYAVIIVSPFASKADIPTIAEHQIVIQLHLEGPENIVIFKEIVAIRNLINSNFNKSVMEKKLAERVNGYKVGNNTVTGVKYRLSKLLINFAELTLDGAPKSIKQVLQREGASLQEIVTGVKTVLLDKPFTESYPLHPSYSLQLSGSNIESSLTPIAQDLIRGEFTALTLKAKSFLQSLSLLNSQGYPDVNESKLALKILDILRGKKGKVTSIIDEIQPQFADGDYGIEKEVINFFLLFLTVQGKIELKARGGDSLDINNIKEKFKSMANFETIAYAKLQEAYSYDFAERLMTTIGLNGSKIKNEKERQSAFKEYKEKIHTIISDIDSLSKTVNSLASQTTLYIDSKAMQNEFHKIEKIKWAELNIDNHTQFARIEHFNSELPQITIALKLLKELTDALDEYDYTQHGIGYMKEALELINQYGILAIDGDKVKQLHEYCSDVEAICSKFETYLDRAQRNPIKGKISQFKSSYIYDIYMPAHKKYVGEGVDWTALNSYADSEVYQRLSVLKNVKSISDASLNSSVLEWNQLERHHCTHTNLQDSLKSGVFCQQCTFPKREENYSEIPPKIGSIESKLNELLAEYEKSIFKEIREYRDNVEFLTDDEKTVVNDILKNKALPETVTPKTIATINKLFQEISVKPIEKDVLIEKLFPSQQMVSLKELRERFFELEAELKGSNDESTVRISLK